MRGYFCLIAFLSVILGCAGASTGDDVIELSYALTSAPKWTTLGSLPAARFAAGPEGAAFEPLGELGVAAAAAVAVAPTVLPGRGAPYPGQREVGEQEAALTAPGLPEEEKKELQRKLAAEERRKAEEAKPWWQRYWHIILPIAIVVVIQVAQGGEKVEEVAQRAASDTPALAR